MLEKVIHNVLEIITLKKKYMLTAVLTKTLNGMKKLFVLAAVML